jgi:hypothetical protein
MWVILANYGSTDCKQLWLDLALGLGLKRKHFLGLHDCLQFVEPQFARIANM